MIHQWARVFQPAPFVLLAALLGAQAEDLALKSRRAKELMAAGRFEEAIPIYRELVRAVPGNPGLLMNLGIAQHMAGRHRGAIEQFRAALKLEPGLTPAWLFLGASYLKLGRPAAAIEPLQKVVQAQPGHSEARQMLGDALLSLDRYQPAAVHFGKLAELQPENPRAWYGLGRSYEALARRAFEQLEKLAPESPWWLALAAESRSKQQQYSSAFYFYRQALARQPEMRGLHAALAEIYRKTGHQDWAAIEEQRERALKPPDCASRKLECGFLAGRFREVTAAGARAKTAESLYWQSRAYNELALDAFARLGSLPPSVEIHELLAEIHRNQGRHLEAAKELREALQLSPGNPRLLRHLAASLHVSRDYQAARPLLEDLVKREPDSAHLNFLLGDCLLNLQEPERAIAYLKKAVEREPKMLPAHSALARAYLQAGQGAQAVPHLKAALPLDEDGSLHYQLARAYQSGGQPELAKEMLKKYQEIRNSAQAQRRALEEEVQITAP